MTSEKLDLLMKITDTKNSTLGRALSFDPSYIGRIRAGKRGIPKHMPFIKPASTFFSKSIKTDYQKKIISEIVCNGKPIPDDKEELERILYMWLSDDNVEKQDSSSMALLLHELSSFTHTVSGTSEADSDSNYINNLSFKTPSYFYGNSGKREAVEIFLSRLCADNKPHTLLLFSDEDMTWLYEDPEFTKKWAGYLIKLLSTGSHIKIIHTINRSFNELMEAIQKWLPLYKSGYIESYYYPRLRDGVYHRTIFIASQKFAITSTSIGKLTNEMANTFIDDSAVLRSLEKEFYNFLSLCVPLMKIHKRSTKGILPLLFKRYEGSDNCVYIANSTTVKQNELSDEINRFAKNNPNTILLNNTQKELPDNISLVVSNNSGVLIITDKLIFDTIEPGFTTASLEYISRLPNEGSKKSCKTIPVK